MKYIIVRLGNEVDISSFSKGQAVTVNKDSTSVTGVVYTSMDVEDTLHTHPAVSKTTTELGPATPALY